jgi:hypothetical protein
MRQVVIAILAASVLAAPSAFAAGDKRSNETTDVVFLNRMLSATGEDTCHAGEIWQGSGNPNTNFQRARNDDGGIELGLKAILRQGADIQATYVDGDGIVHIEVPSGAQPGNAARAAWNFTYSYDVSASDEGMGLDRYDAELWIDLDPSVNVNYMKLKLARLGSPSGGPCPTTNGLGWKLADGSVVIGDDEGTDKVTQNSQNLAFYASQIDTDRKASGIQPYTFGTGHFDVVLTIKRKGGKSKTAKTETALHVVFDVVDAPSQTP